MRAFKYAVPLLFICMCTFIANDLDDLERDQINHPDRPLPRKHLSLSLAVLLYFICLAMALFLTEHFIQQQISFLYYVLMVLSISYGYVVEYLPSFKAPYVAALISIPLFIVATSFSEEKRLFVVAIAGFFFALGRELCMDISDRTGDIVSAVHKIHPNILALTAFIMQFIAILMLFFAFHQLADIPLVGSMALVLLFSLFFWFKLENKKVTIRLMKIQMLIGLYFLI